MVSIIVCTYNREKFIGHCLRSIAAQTAHSNEFELVFVDNNSTDQTAAIFSEFKRTNPRIHCRYVLEESQGLSYARNRGIKESKGEVIAFLDDDAIAGKDYVRYLIDDVLNSPCLAGGGKIIPYWEDERPAWMGRFLLPLVSVIDLGDQQRIFRGAKYPIGANMFFKRIVFDRFGEFNTELGRMGRNLMGGEEKELFNRIRKAGEEICYFPSISVHHIIPAERTTTEFIKAQAIGIGVSERTRTNYRGLAYSNRLFLELLKWGATGLIAMGYLVRFQRRKAMMLVQFRLWVTRGLLNKV